MRGKKSHLARESWSRTHQHTTVHEVEGTEVDADAAKEFVLTIGNKVKNFSLGQSGCESREDGLVMIDSGTSVNVCHKWLGQMQEHSKIRESQTSD